MATNNSINAPLPVTVDKGGSGNTSFTAYSVVCAGTSTTGPFTNVTGVGNAGDILTSNGAGVYPEWLPPTTTIPQALTRTDDTNVTLTLGGSPSTALLSATSITAGWSGQLSMARGGTAASLTAANGAVPYSSASAIALLAPGTSGQLFQSGGAGAPNWTTATFPSTASSAGKVLRADGTNWAASTSTFADTYSASTLLYSNGANTVAGLATANNGVLITNGSGVPSIGSKIVTGNLPNGTILQVVSTTKTSVFSTSSSSLTDWTGMSVTIVPVSSSSKILVTVTSGVSSDSDNSFQFASLFFNVNGGGYTQIALGDSSGSATRCWMDASWGFAGGVGGSDYLATEKMISGNFLHTHGQSAGDTLIYKLQVIVTAGGTAYFGRTSSTSDANRSSIPSTITVMEIAA